jgi:hypothetical protein
MSVLDGSHHEERSLAEQMKQKVGAPKIGATKPFAPTLPTQSLLQKASLDGSGASEQAKFISGAKRSEFALRYDLIPTDGIRREAKVWTEGAAKYGDYNWQKGRYDPEFQKQVVCHLFEHILKFLEGDRTEDHLTHAICNIRMLDFFEQAEKEEV